MQHTASNAPAHKKNKPCTAYRMMRDETEYWELTFTGRRAGFGALCGGLHRKLGGYMLKHQLAGAMPMTVALGLVAELGCDPRTADKRMAALLESPYAHQRGKDFVLTYFAVLNGGPAQARQRQQLKRQQGAARQANLRLRQRANVVQQTAQNRPCESTQANVTPIKHYPKGPVKNLKKISKHQAPRPGCLPQAAKKKELTGMGAILGQVLAHTPVACQAAPKPADAVAPAPAPTPTPAPQPETYQDLQLPGVPEDIAALLGGMRQAQAGVTPLPAKAPAAPPRPAAPQPKAVAPAAPPREPQGQAQPQQPQPQAPTGGVPAAYSWRKLDRGWFEDVVASRCPGANYRAFAALGASVPLLIDGLHLVERASTTIRNPPALLYRTCQRLQSGEFKALR